MDGLFEDLDDKALFTKYVKEIFTKTPVELEYFFKIKNKISDDHISLAFDKYKYEIEWHATYLDSKNPDHYKRAGSLLQSLDANPIVTKIECDYNSEEIANGFTQFNNFDAAHIERYLRFHETYCNEFAAFNAAYIACCSYEQQIKPITVDLIQHICHFLKANKELPSDAYFMVFKLLMA